MPKKILFLLNSFENDNAGTLALEVSRRLAASGKAECCVSAISDGGGLKGSLHDAGILTQSFEGVFKAITGLPKLLDSYHFDAVHTSLLKADLIGRWLARRKDVSEIFSTEFGLHLHDAAGKALRPWLDSAWRATARNAKTIVAVSEFVRSQLLNAGLPAKQIVLIRNGVDLEVFQPLSEDEKRKARMSLGLDPEAVLAVCAGKMIPSAGHLTFLKAMLTASRQAARESIRLQGAIVGEGPLFAEIQMFLRQHHTQLNVHLPELTNAQLPIFIGCADLVVEPCRIDSCGLSVIRGMACGVPAIATHLGGIPEIIENRVHGRLVSPDAPDEMARRILELALSSSERKNMGQAALKRARSDFGIERTVAKYAEMFLGKSQKAQFNDV